MKIGANGIAVIAALIGTPALAADIAVKAPPPNVPIPVYSWTGFYVGGTAGGAWGSFDPTTSAGTGYFIPSAANAVSAAGTQNIKSSGFTGGLEAGYNWQPNNFVFGFEGDFESFSLRGNSSSGFVVYPGLGGIGFALNSRAETTWLATARERVGLAVNNWLFFATAGAAFTTLKANFTFNDDNPCCFAAETGSISSTRIGYTVGGGVEAALWGNWSIKAEYLYVNFGSVSATSNTLTTAIGPFPADLFTHSINLKANMARLGLNYHF